MKRKPPPPPPSPPVRDWRAEARQVILLAVTSRTVAGRWIAGAIDDTYDRLARDLLIESEAKARSLGLTPAEHRQEVSAQVLLLASKLLLKRAKRKKSPTL